MHLDTTFPLSEQSPFKGTQTLVNCRRIKGIDVSMQLEDVNDSTSLSFSYDLIGKLFEDALVTLCIGIRKSTLGSGLTKSKVIGFGCMSLGCQDNITKTFAVGKLTEHQDCKLVPAGKLLDITIPIGFVCKSEEYILIDEV